MSFDQAFLNVLGKTAADNTDGKRRRRYAGEQLEQLIRREGSEDAILVCERVCKRATQRASFWNMLLGILAGQTIAFFFGPVTVSLLLGTTVGLLLWAIVITLWRKRYCR